MYGHPDDRSVPEPVTDAPPLAGIVVVELGHSVAGAVRRPDPRRSRRRRDQGREARRATTRAHWGPPFVDGAAATFQALNRNKRSVVLRPARPRAAARGSTRLDRSSAPTSCCRTCAPARSTQLGLGAAALRAQKPSLIYCNIGAFGRRGPLARAARLRPADAGLRRHHERHRRARPASRCASARRSSTSGTGMWAVIGIVLALYRRASHGRRRRRRRVAVRDRRGLDGAAFARSPRVRQRCPASSAPGRPGIVPYRAYRDGRRRTRRRGRQQRAVPRASARPWSIPSGSTTRASSTIPSASRTPRALRADRARDAPAGRTPNGARMLDAAGVPVRAGAERRADARARADAGARPAAASLPGLSTSR